MKIRVPTILGIIPKTEKSLRMTTKENHPRKRAVQQAQTVGSDRRTKKVSRREISKNFFKKERKFEMTDYCHLPCGKLHLEATI